MRASGTDKTPKNKRPPSGLLLGTQEYYYLSSVHPYVFTINIFRPLFVKKFERLLETAMEIKKQKGKLLPCRKIVSFSNFEFLKICLLTYLNIILK